MSQVTQATVFELETYPIVVISVMWMRKKGFFVFSKKSFFRLFSFSKPLKKGVFGSKICLTGHPGYSFRVRDISYGSNIPYVDAKKHFFCFFEKMIFSVIFIFETLKKGGFWLKNMSDRSPRVQFSS
jgi:hypothetical protein